MPGGRGFCAPAGGDVGGKEFQLCPCGNQVCVVLHPPPVQQLFPARCPGTDALSPQCPPWGPQKGAATQITSAVSLTINLFLWQITVKSEYVFVYKVTKQQMRLSIRQKRQVHNRNCATAAGEHTVVSNLFEGQLSYMTLCMHCDHQEHSTQTFTVLSLPIPADTTKCSIQVTSNSCCCLLFPCHISDTSHPPHPLLFHAFFHLSVSMLCRTACPCSLSRPS